MSEGKLKVLQMLAEHKITAEDAGRLLDAVKRAEEAEATAEPPGQRRLSQLGDALVNGLRAWRPHAAGIGRRIEEDVRRSIAEAMKEVECAVAEVSGELADLGDARAVVDGDGESVVSFEVAPDDVVAIVSGGGDIVVRGGASGSRMDLEGDGPVRMSRSAGRVAVRHAGGDVDVQLPAVARLEVRGSGGDIMVESVPGDLAVSGSGGDLTIEGCEGPLEGTTRGGCLCVEGVATGLKVESQGGDVVVNGALITEGEHVVSSTGGDIDLTILDGASLRIIVSAMGGDVDCDLPLVESSVGLTGQTRICRVGDGEGTLMVKAMGGDVTVRCSGER